MDIINIAVAASHSPQEPSTLGFLLPIFILVLMYFILIRPQSKKLKEHKAMIEELKARELILCRNQTDEKGQKFDLYSKE